MGFSFAMQDRNDFYLFQWKQGDQEENGCTGRNGMQVKRMKLGNNETFCDFWGKEKTDRAELIYVNDIPWEANVEYKFVLTFHPGEFNIEVEGPDGGEVSNFTVKDDSFTSGMFGFYNYSQPFISYRGFQLPGFLLKHTVTRLRPTQRTLVLLSTNFWNLLRR